MGKQGLLWEAFLIGCRDSLDGQPKATVATRWTDECARQVSILDANLSFMNTERKEPTYTFTEAQVAEKSELARRFIETRSRLNTTVDKADNYLVKRFYNIDHNTYLEGAIPAKYKELMGLVVSAGLRCDDCIHYHIIQSYRLRGKSWRAGRGAECGAGRGREHRDSSPAAGLCDVGGVVLSRWAESVGGSQRFRT